MSRNIALKTPLYLDHAATSPMTDEGLQFYIEQLKTHPYNSETVIEPGLKVKQKLEQARDVFAGRCGCNSKDVVFTSGGTESNNLAMHALAKGKEKGVLWISKTAHPSQREATAHLPQGWQVLEMPCLVSGVVELRALKGLPSPDMVAVEWVNSEAGFVQPLEALAEVMLKKNPASKLLVDGVQGFGKLPLPDLKNVDAFSMSGHKLGAPVGVGALMLRAESSCPLFYGGGQEGGMRSGTVGVPQILSFAHALESFGQKPPEIELEDTALKFIKSPDVEYSPYILLLDTDPVEGEVLLHHLEQKGVYVGLGSACSSRKKNVSATHLAMGMSSSQSRCTLRLSFTSGTSSASLEEAFARIRSSLHELKRFFNG